MCPVTSAPLSADDLIAVRVGPGAKPRSTAATSVPGMLAAFHDEWDALMLETHELRKDLHAARQELSHALYQHDAACRVIARTVKERDEARAALANARGAAGAAAKRGADAPAEAMDADSNDPKRAKGGISAEALEAMAACGKELQKTRKSRPVSDSLAAPDTFAAMADKPSSAPCHPTKCKGILCVTANPLDSNVVATAGADGSVAVFDVAKGKRSKQIAVSKKRVKSAAWCGVNVLLTGAADGAMKIWSSATGSCAATVDGTHAGEIVSVAPHPTNAYAVTFGADGAWAFHDVQKAETLCVVREDDTNYGAGAFHPDGLLLGACGADGVSRIWDVRGQKRAAELTGHQGKVVSSISFSENGYYVATAAADGARVWDLRKLKELRFFDGAKNAETAVAFDKSGHYLALGSGVELSVRAVKKDWEVVKQWQAPKTVLSLAFGEDARSVFAGCADHNLRVFA